MREEGIQTIEAIETYLEKVEDLLEDDSLEKDFLEGGSLETGDSENLKMSEEKGTGQADAARRDTTFEERAGEVKDSADGKGGHDIPVDAVESRESMANLEGMADLEDMAGREGPESQGVQQNQESQNGRTTETDMMRILSLILKRSIDLVGSALGILMISPVLIILVIAIMLDSKGPVFYIQERLGRDGKIFKIMKFRTMVVGAEFMGAGLSIDGEDDPRITRIGRFLRATSLDELPQLFNVVKGEMSLVGPRPPLESSPYEGYAGYPEDLRKRFTMRPGITGLAQVTVRTSVPWAERLPLDVQYIENFSLMLDFRILLKTAIRVIGRKDIYAPKKESGA